MIFGSENLLIVETPTECSSETTQMLPPQMLPTQMMPPERSAQISPKKCSLPVQTGLLAKSGVQTVLFAGRSNTGLSNKNTSDAFTSCFLSLEAHI